MEYAEKVLRQKIGHAPGRVPEQILSHLVGVGWTRRFMINPVGAPNNAPAQGVTWLDLQVGVGDARDRHAGPTVPVSGRDDLLRFLLDKPKGRFASPTFLHDNARQLTIVADNDGEQIARAMGLPDGRIPDGLQGENIIVQGMTAHGISFPVGSTAVFFTGEGVFRDATLYITGDNNPCAWPGRNIQKHYGDGFTPLMSYQEAASGRRGWTATVESAEKGGSRIYVGDYVAVFTGGV